MEGMKARLDERLGPVESDPNSFGPNGEGRNKEDGDWEIQDVLAQWWRPNFETFMVSRIRIRVTARIYRCWTWKGTTNADASTAS